MRNSFKLVLGVIFCLIGAIILISSLLYVRIIPGGFISLAIGIMLNQNLEESLVPEMIIEIQRSGLPKVFLLAYNSFVPYLMFYS